MKRLFSLVSILFFAISAMVVLLPKDSQAIPAFARQAKMDCITCHYQYPKLNEFGIMFKNNGYRMPGIVSGKNVWDFENIPLAAIIRAQGETTWGNPDDETKLATEHLEIILATAIGDHFSVFAALEQEKGEEVRFSGNLSADNLTGVLGQLNIKVGNHVAMEWDNYSQMRRILTTNYLAMDTVGTLMMHGPEGFAGEAASVEAFGQFISDGPMPTIRYKFAIHNVEDLNEDRASNIGGAYSFVTLSFGQGKVLVGLMADYTLEPEGMAMAGDGHAVWDDTLATPAAVQHMPMGNTLNTDVVRVGANVEVNIDKAAILLAWNYQNRNENGMTGAANFREDAEVHNFMAELLYQLTSKILLGVREDYVMAEQGSLDGEMNRFTVGVYNYIMPNVKIGAEFENEERQQLQPMMGKPMNIGSTTAESANWTQNVAKLVFEFDF